MLEGSAKLRVVALAALIGRSISDLPPLDAEAACPSFPAALPDNVKIDLISRRADITASRWRVEAAERNLGFRPRRILSGRQHQCACRR